MEILQKIDRLKAELEALRPLDAEREGRIMQKFRLDWNYHSNHLEGNSLTYGETKALILFGITAQGKPLKDHLEMTGHNEAIKWIEEVVKEERPLTENFIRQLHELLLKEPYQVDAVTPDGQPTKKWIQIGQYKSSPNNVVTVTGEIFYFATPEETPAMMTDLVDWYRAENEKRDLPDRQASLHPLHLAALFHYRFVRIHPFDDGNGRTARILMNFILLQHGLPPVIIKTEDKQHYFAALRQADAGLLEPFIEYIGENLEKSLELMVRGAKGESIDEVDDGDKEIALLVQKLKQSKAKTFVPYSEEAVAKIIDFSLDQIIIKFITAFEKFSRFYVECNIMLWVGSFGQYLIGKPAELSGLYAGSISDNIKGAIIQSRIFELQVSFFTFNQKGYGHFGYHTKIECKFGIPSYTLSNKDGTCNFTKYYDEFLTEEEIDEVIRTETKAHTAFIEQKIEEAQQRLTPKG